MTCFKPVVWYAALGTILLVRPRYNFARSSQNHSAGEDKITPGPTERGRRADLSWITRSSGGCANADRVSAPTTSIQSAKADHSVVGRIYRGSLGRRADVSRSAARISPLPQILPVQTINPVNLLFVVGEILVGFWC